jgi:hypothetical protein
VDEGDDRDAEGCDMKRPPIFRELDRRHKWVEVKAVIRDGYKISSMRCRVCGKRRRFSEGYISYVTRKKFLPGLKNALYGRSPILYLLTKGV